MERKVNIRCHKTECFPRECFRFSAPSLLCLLRREEREQEPWPPIHPIHPSLARSPGKQVSVSLSSESASGSGSHQRPSLTLASLEPQSLLFTSCIPRLLSCLRVATHVALPRLVSPYSVLVCLFRELLFDLRRRRPATVSLFTCQEGEI